MANSRYSDEEFELQRAKERGVPIVTLEANANKPETAYIPFRTNSLSRPCSGGICLQDALMAATGVVAKPDLRGADLTIHEWSKCCKDKLFQFTTRQVTWNKLVGYEQGHISEGIFVVRLWDGHNHYIVVDRWRNLLFDLRAHLPIPIIKDRLPSVLLRRLGALNLKSVHQCMVNRDRLAETLYV